MTASMVVIEAVMTPDEGSAYYFVGQLGQLEP